MRLSSAVLNFIARNRYSLPVACGSAALFMLVYQAELDPPPASAVKPIEVQASAVGVLQMSVMGRRDNIAVAQRDAGYAIEYTLWPPQPGAPLPPPARKLFASELELTASELKWIRGHGPVYRVGILRDQVVFIESMTQPLVTYERYTKSAIVKRNLWRLCCALVVALGAACYVLGTRQHLHADA